MAMIIKPKKLEKGSTIAFIAPSGPPPPERLKRGKRFFEQAGYRVRVYPQTRHKFGYLAGNDQERADALADAFSDDQVDAVMCVRGGYGALRLLPCIDFNVIANNPKIFIGYSDITILLLSIFKRGGFVTFHGPMAASDFGKGIRSYTKDRFFETVTGDMKVIKIDIPRGYRVARISGGSAKGRMVGGNLCLMSKLIGTGFLPAFKNRIVYFEDTEEEPYRIDGYLSQLFQTTDLGQAAGYIIGEFTRCEIRDYRMKGWNVRDVIDDYFGDIGKPVIYGFPCGHGKEKITIPIGVRAELNADSRTLIFKEAGVK
jgi:muramoyltetrapeptide carboxypeptidase